jgi:hypothetical protein
VGGVIGAHFSGSLKDLKEKAHSGIHYLRSFIPGASQGDEDEADHELDQAIDQNPNIVWGYPVSTHPSSLPGATPPPQYGVPQPGAQNFGGWYMSSTRNPSQIGPIGSGYPRVSQQGATAANGTNPSPSGVLQRGPENVGYQFMRTNKWGAVVPGGTVKTDRKNEVH